ncbi:MAG TPA: lysophospholipid acyltransferase family protein, partial [Actinotalea sp.]|nr:lysophospholipid acyltransferase family protein [Actinotalea sp.]
RENLPSTGAVVIAANHVSVIDGPLLHGVVPRDTHLLVKREAFRGVVGAILRGAGQIPVDRVTGRSALEAALAVLRRGGAVGIFPEGGRGDGAVQSVRAGVAWLAVHGGAPVVPVAILGTRRTGEGIGHLPAPRRPPRRWRRPSASTSEPRRSGTGSRCPLMGPGSARSPSCADGDARVAPRPSARSRFVGRSTGRGG